MAVLEFEKAGLRRAPARFSMGAILAVLSLAALAAAWLLPLAWIAVTSLKPAPAIIRLPIRWLPAHPTAHNFAVALTTNRTAPISRAFLNSTIVAVSETLLTLALDTMAGYALARLEFPGRRLAFGVVVASIMVPFQVTLVPLYLMFQQAGWLNTYQALVLPGLSRAFGVFLMRQFFLTLPRDLSDAARIDGAVPPPRFLLRRIRDCDGRRDGRRPSADHRVLRGAAANHPGRRPDRDEGLNGGPNGETCPPCLAHQIERARLHRMVTGMDGHA